MGTHEGLHITAIRHQGSTQAARRRPLSYCRRSAAERLQPFGARGGSGRSRTRARCRRTQIRTAAAHHGRPGHHRAHPCRPRGPRCARRELPNRRLVLTGTRLSGPFGRGARSGARSRRVHRRRDRHGRTPVAREPRNDELQQQQAGHQTHHRCPTPPCHQTPDLRSGGGVRSGLDLRAGAGPDPPTRPAALPVGRARLRPVKPWCDDSSLSAGCRRKSDGKRWLLTGAQSPAPSTSRGFGARRSSGSSKPLNAVVVCCAALLYTVFSRYGSPSSAT